MTDTANTYDFRRPNQLADDVEQMLEQWCYALLKVAKSRISKKFDFAFDWETGEIQAMQLDAIVEANGVPVLILQHNIGGIGVGWLTLPRKIVLSVFDQMMGNEFTELPEDRPLTSIENSLFTAFTNELSEAMSETQPCESGLLCKQFGEPRFEEIGNVFSETEQIVVVEIKLQGNFEGQSFFWHMSQDATLSFVTHVTESMNANDNPRPELERLIHQIPMNVVVNLGRAKLHWNELTNLSVGDVIVLDQRVTDPLQAAIENQHLFRGWAGRNGKSQAFRISEIVDPETS
ncbi:FliM/FliN family flagellar motor switch protein [Planctomycetota bacterium]